jgi:hypothetical protein
MLRGNRAHWASGLIDGHFYNYGNFPDVVKKMETRFAPLPDVKVGLYIQFRKGNKPLAHVVHDALIDLPDPADKWNIFALPGSADWIKVFEPFGGWGGRSMSSNHFPTAGNEPYDYKLQDLYKAGNKEEYAKLMKTIWKEADNIKVVSENVYNIRWPRMSEYEYEMRERLKEQKNKRAHSNSKPAVAKPKQQQPKAENIDDLLGSTGYSEAERSNALDDLLGSTGYSKAERAEALGDLLGSTGYNKQEVAERNIEKADAAYDRIKDYKDKVALTEAHRLYQQETGNPADAEHARNQIARIDKVLNYKPISVDLEGTYRCTRGCGFTFTFNRDGILTDNGNYSYINLSLEDRIIKTDKKIEISSNVITHGVTFLITNNGIVVDNGYERIR